MKKLIIGVLAVGAALALLPAVKRRMVQKMRDHCTKMMSQCAGSSERTAQETTSPAAMPQKMREHCAQIAAHHEERKELVGAA